MSRKQRSGMLLAEFGAPTTEEAAYLMDELQKDDAALVAAAEHLRECEERYAAVLHRRELTRAALVALTERAAL